MRICIPLFMLLLVLSSGQLIAQQSGMSKEEIKEWKNKAKEYRRNPAALKALTQERDLLLENQSQLQSRLTSLESELMAEKSKIVELEQENVRLNNSLTVTQQTLVDLQNRQAQMMEQQQQIQNTVSTSTPAVSEGGMPMGTVFMIQVGAFRRGGVPAKFSRYSDLYVEQAGGMDKVLIGQYRNYNDAKIRLSQLKGEGYSSAWIVPFIDGRRVSLKEALR